EPQIAALAAQGARVVLLPEKLTGIAPAYEDEVFARFSAAARASQVYLVVGLNRIGRPQRLNSALVFGPDGRLLLDYTKRYLLPGFETGYAVGEVPGFFELDGRKVGVMICKDLDFPLWARRYSQAGARLVLAPAWDFVADGPLHAHMGQMRAIEQGFSLARSAQEGLLAAWDDRLRHRHETPTAAAPDVSLVVDLPLGRGPTLYSRWGDWLAWSSVVASLVLLAASWRRRQEG
nr:carbon-nitrogen hydrolase family protein [Thermoanaerobaculia bacterium]